jgi:hypothetical protein
VEVYEVYIMRLELGEDAAERFRQFTRVRGIGILRTSFAGFCIPRFYGVNIAATRPPP